jgi:ribosomal protein L11 methyltransferase
MIWQEVKLYTSSVGAEMLAAELLRLGVAGWQVEAPSEVRDYLADENSPFDYADESLRRQAVGEGAVLTLYLADDSQGEGIIRALEELLPQLKAQDSEGAWGELRLQVNRRSSEEWEDNWKQYYKPFKVGDKLVVRPSWEEYEPSEGEKVLVIEPGGSFGTGQHHTTRLCLELLEKWLPEDAKLLDLGCGTGILSIGGVLLGAKSAVAVDIEEHSAAAAAENAARNGIDGEKYLTRWGNVIDDKTLLDEVSGYAGDGGYDIIVVNIVADVIMAMSPLFAGLLAGSGRVICSGVIDTRRAEVLECMAWKGFRLVDERDESGWCAMVFDI